MRPFTLSVLLSLFFSSLLLCPQHARREMEFWERHEDVLRNDVGMEFVLTPAGEFLMGSNDGKGDEKPVHRVQISQPFYLGVYEVTQAQWEAVHADSG